MNQRRAKTYKATGMDDHQGMRQVQFIKACKVALESSGYDDAAYYFEQIEDWIRAGKSLDPSKAARILGL